MGMKPETIEHAEIEIFRWLIEGEGASLGNASGMAALAERLGAGLDENDEPINKTAHNRFKNATKRVHAQMNRLLEQRIRKVSKRREGDA